MIVSHKITLVTMRKPHYRNINEKLQWFGSSLGLFNLRDKDKSCYRIFIELIKSSKRNKTLSSDELAERLGLSRGTVVHHLQRLMEAGLVLHESNKYILRVHNLKALVSEVEKDVKRMTEDLKEVADEIDESLGL